MLVLQRQAGNRAVAGLVAGAQGGRPPVVQRAPRSPRPPGGGTRDTGGSGGSRPADRLGRGWERLPDGRYGVTDTFEAMRGPIPPYPKGGDVRAALAAERPGMLAVLTESELDQWQQAVDRSAAERGLKRLVAALLARFPAIGTQGSPLEQQAPYKAWRRRAEAALPPPGPAGGTLRIETGRLLDPDIMKIDFDVEAEKAFRLWAIRQLTAGGVTLRLVDPLVEDMRHAQQMLPIDGVLTARSLRSIFPDEHRAWVSDRPVMVQLRQLVRELEAIHDEVDPDFQNRLELNEKYSGGLAFVRKWSEWLGEGDTDMPDAASWNAPYHYALRPGARLLGEGKFELAVPLLRRAYDELPAVADQFARYEHRVQTGARTAVKWLGRVKTVGAIAATLAAGPLGSVWRAAGVAGAYSGAQSVAQQASEIAVGQRSSLDLGAAAEDAAMSSAMTLIGMPLQARMQARIVQSLVGRGALEQGVTATVLQQEVASVLAGMLSEVYLTPTQVVMSHVVSGKAGPASLDELCDMIVDQALTSGALTVATDTAHARLTRLRAERAAAGVATPPTDVPVAAVPRRSQEIGGQLLAMGETLAAAGGGSSTRASTGAQIPAPTPAPTAAGDPATGKAASIDPALGSRVDPARTPDPSTEVGLSSPDAVKRVAHGVYELSERPVRRAASDVALIDIAAEQIMEIVARELPADLPRPRIVVGRRPDPDHLGSYIRETHTIWINADAQTTVGRTTEAAFQPMGDGYKRLLGLIYHEARHAEQLLLALRVAAGRLPGPRDPGRDALTLHRVHEVDARLARAAAGRPIEPADGSPEARLGRDLFEENLGTGPRRLQREFAQSWMGDHHEWVRTIDDIRDTLVELHQKGGYDSEEWRGLVDLVRRTEGDLDRARRLYFGLAEEIDARRAEFTVESAFDRIVDAQLHLNMARIRLATAQRALDAVPADKQTDDLQEMVRVVDAARKLREEFARAAALLPTPSPSPR